MYNYEAAVRKDVQQAIEHNYTEDEIIQHLAEDRDEWQDKLYDDLWVDDRVTGNKSGSYTYSYRTAGKYLEGNWSLLKKALEAFGLPRISGVGAVSRDIEECDVIIRCYLLSGAIDAVLDEYEEEYSDEIAAYQGE